MGRIVCFGEVMLRLGPEGYYRFHQADRFVLNYTGAEANAAVALSQFGMETEVVTKLPDHAIAKAAVAELKKFGAGTRFIQFGGERMGVYFIEKGASQRASKVIYDRKNTSISAVRPGEFDWETIFEGASAFLFSGVTAALSDTIPDVLAEACEKAKEKGVKIFCDLNYRKNLWTPEKAQVTMKRLVKYVDVLVGNEEDSEKMLGVKAGASDVHKGELDTASYVDVAKQLQRGIRLRGRGHHAPQVDIRLGQQVVRDALHERNGLSLQGVRHPDRGQGGRRRLVHVRPHVRHAQRLRQQEGPRIRGGRLLPETQYRIGFQPRLGGGDRRPYGRRRLRTSAAMKKSATKRSAGREPGKGDAR